MIHIVGGGTYHHITNHLALAAPAYGRAARVLHQKFQNAGQEATLHLTKMADPLQNGPDTVDDLSDLVDHLVADPDARAIIMTSAVVDWRPTALWAGDTLYDKTFGPDDHRLSTRQTEEISLDLVPAEKLVNRIRKSCKDKFLVSFKTTLGVSEDEQFAAGLGLLKESSSNLVLVNDVKTRLNYVLTPEEARYGDGTRGDAFGHLVRMVLARSQNSFTRSTVVGSADMLVPWTSDLVSSNLREVVDHMVKMGAYKPFQGKTVGHFASKIGENEFLTSIRKTNFNVDLYERGLLRITSVGDDEVIAYGAKPSVGGQSQRQIFRDHPGFTCIAHAHVPLRVPGSVNTVEQWPNECGSHQCGQATSRGLRDVAPGIKAVFLDKHGPNVVFRPDVDPANVIRFIDDHFDLSAKTR